MRPVLRPPGAAHRVEPDKPQTGAFTFAVIPDTHSDYKASFEDLNKLATWIASESKHRNIQMVAHLGDIADRRGGKPIGEALEFCRDAMQPILDANIPLLVCAGNHDYDAVNSTRSANEWNAPGRFGLDMYSQIDTFGGTFESESDSPGIMPGGTLNHYHVLPGRILVLCLELGPRDKVMQWANNLVLNRFQDHDVFVFTHSYLHLDGTRVTEGTPYNPKGYSGFSTEPGPEYTNDGEDLWVKYFRHWPNLRSVHSGHAINSPQQAYLVSTGVHGNPVHQFFCNWQNYGADVVRLYTIHPARNVVYIANYNALTGEIKAEAVPEEHGYK